MDISTHAASGAVVGLLLAPVRWTGRPLSRRLTVTCCTLGAVMPDIDAVTYGLGRWGRAAFHGSSWYSHHQASHSFLGCAVLAALFAFAWSRVRVRRGETTDWRPVAVLLFVGGVVHLLGDLPTPPGPWGGLPLLFPLPARFGGWSLVWWWHHYYVMFLLLLALTGAALVYAGERAWRPMRRVARPLQASLAAVALLLVVRYFAVSRFDGTGTWYDKDQRAIEVQEQWLPAPVHAVFEWASSVLPGWS